MKTKHKNKFFFSIFILLPIILAGIFVISTSLSPYTDEGGIYIKGNDLIKNFEIHSFDGEHLTSGNTVPSLGNKLKLESGPFWKAYKEDLQNVQIHQIGEQIFFEYEITFTNYINIYTNVLLEQATENDLDIIKDTIRSGAYGHKGLLGDYLFYWYSYLYWSHYNFGNVRTYNGENNLFSGNVEMDFDIASSPLPDIFTDEEGNAVTKEFDYIGISAVYVGNQSYGKMSNDMPTVEGITPSEYSTSKSEYSGGGKAGPYADGYSYTWNPKITLSEEQLTDIVDYGIQTQTSGTSLNPKQKDGSAIWDARNTETSMTDCKFIYSLGRICPLVYRYKSTLSYDEISLVTQDHMKSFIPLVFDVIVDYYNVRRVSLTEDSALHVINRYVQSEIKVTFNIYSSFTVDLDLGEFEGLSQPTEYYDELLWTTIVDGFGGGFTHRDERRFDLFSPGVWIIIGIVAVIIIAVVIFWKFGSQIILIKALRRTNKK